MVCDGLCAWSSDLPKMWGVDDLPQTTTTIPAGKEGERWVCFDVCPEMPPIVRGMVIIKLGQERNQRSAALHLLPSDGNSRRWRASGGLCLVASDCDTFRQEGHREFWWRLFELRAFLLAALRMLCNAQLLFRTNRIVKFEHRQFLSDRHDQYEGVKKYDSETTRIRPRIGLKFERNSGSSKNQFFDSRTKIRARPTNFFF
ncbi:unnamed protein product [Nesidiocoris tenuis]|uniref:Uncharacterized protein n=1 Tax=Nesidiocoris tenuis TaxID=355587 RepID=A0A6H5H812_9HEMI|nr:unnamed protein product [Nesidiocoris tenuis]